MNTQEFHTTIAQTLASFIIEKMNKNDRESLVNLGINSDLIKIIEKMKITKYPLIVAAISEGIFYGIDENKFKASLVFNTNKNIDTKIINKFIQAGASFELCRHFFNNHTNRKHTEMRKRLVVKEVVFGSNKNKLSIDQSYVFFSEKLRVRHSNNITAQDIYDIHLNNKVSLNLLWKYFQEYLNDSLNN